MRAVDTTGAGDVFNGVLATELARGQELRAAVATAVAAAAESVTRRGARVTPAGLAAMLERGPVVLDGGLATELERLGHDLGDSLWSARLLRDRPGTSRRVHRAYFEAGADVAITASYHATYEGFAAAGIGAEETTRLLRLSVELAQRARDAVRPGGLVAASVGPFAVMLADGSEYTGDYGDDFRGARSRRVHRPRIAALLDAGPDLLALETIPSLRSRCAALVELLAEFPGVEAWMTFCCRDGERLSDGTPIEDAVATGGRQRGDRRASASTARRPSTSTRCSSAPPRVHRPAAARLSEQRPDLGRRRVRVARSGRRRLPAPVVAGWREHGARGIGGCCGIGPDAIAGVAGVLRGLNVHCGECSSWSGARRRRG